MTLFQNLWLSHSSRAPCRSCRDKGRLYPPLWACAVDKKKSEPSAADGGELTLTVKVPSFPTVGQNVTLECDLDLGGNPLESIKWLKDDSEFYAITPQGATTKYCPGICIDMKNSSRVKVTIQKVTEQTSGMFKCELRAGGRMMMKGAGMKVQPKK